jgi:hypothetical protein
MPALINEKHFELIGWIGFILIVSAYLFVTIRQIEVNSAAYHLMNLTGAFCMAINAKHNEAKPLFWLNIVWSLIALIGLLRLYKP